MTMTPELKQAIEQAGDEPVRVDDPQSNTSYLLIRADLYEKMSTAFKREEIDASFFEYENFTPIKQ